MKIAVIGLGSMGKRRIRLIRKILGDKVEIYGVESNEKRRLEVQCAYGIITVPNLKSLFRDMVLDVVFISTSPLSHANLISICLEHDVHVFTEINLLDTDYEKNINLAKEKNKVLFLSSTMLYRKEIQFFARKIKEAKCQVNYTYHVGQYLPDWHPWDRLEDFFISNKVTNGCREIFAIELPWILDAFGSIAKLEISKSKASNLPIEYADNYLLLVEHENGNKGLLAVDVISREAVRDLSIFGEKLFLKWDGTPQGVICKDLLKGNLEYVNLYEDLRGGHVNGYSSNIVENAYEEEILNFFAVIDGVELPKYDFYMDKEILRIIDKIEED